MPARLLTRLKRAAAWAQWVVVGLLAGLFLLFAANNRAHIDVSLFPLPYQAEMPLFLLTMLAFCTGMLIGGALLALRNARLRRLLTAARRRAEALENELTGIKSEPRRMMVPPPPAPPQN